MAIHGRGVIRGRIVAGIDVEPRIEFLLFGLGGKVPGGFGK